MIKMNTIEISKMYSKVFFKREDNEWKIEYFKKIATHLTNLFKPKSVLDVGCGTGELLNGFIHNDVKDYFGVDGSVNAIDYGFIDKEYLLLHNLEEPLNLNRKFDLVASVEVAEHIKKEFADVFVKTLIANGDTIYITAAPPGQAGTGHYNCQPKQYWIDLFKKNGYDIDKVNTTKIMGLVGIDGAQGHLGRNSMIFRKCVE
jgi:SAM-dependent methyltransferase